MAIIRKTRAQITAELVDRDTLARLDAMAQEEMDANADNDPDNPTWSAEELERGVRERDERLARGQSAAERPSIFE